MPLSGTSGVEDRDAAGNFLAVFTFDAAVTSGNAQVVGGTATAGTPTFSGNEMRVPLTNVADVQTVTVEVSGVNGGGATSDVDFGFLIGDVDGNRTVEKADDNIIQADRNQAGHWLQLPRRHQSERSGGEARPPRGQEPRAPQPPVSGAE